MMTQNLKQNKNKGSSLLNKGASFICCGTPEYTYLFYKLFSSIIDLLNRSFKLSILEEKILEKYLKNPITWIGLVLVVTWFLTKSSEFLIFGVCVLLLVFASQSD